MFSLLHAFLATATTIAFAATSPNPFNSLTCCETLAKNTKAAVLWPDSETYSARVDSYFSPTARLQPHCILQPLTAAEVSVAVQTLVHGPCKFAIRSGGHMAIPGWSNIEDGVTIDLGWMNKTVRHPKNSTASLQPGTTWGGVYSTLDDLGVMVAGGRAYTVGVGGLILGGGNSFYAARKGLVCDTVVQFEVVLASADVVLASRTENSDLFRVLKGGGNNFGVVTSIDVEAFEGGSLWGGLVMYPESTAEQQFEALTAFHGKLEEDPFSSAIVMDTYLSEVGGDPLFFNVFDYTAPVARPASFNHFLDIPGNFSDTTRIANMTSLAQELVQPSKFR
jgi:FAD/FMN-containing dehydrogenase